METLSPPPKVTMDEKARTSMSKFSKLEDNMYELDTD